MRAWAFASVVAVSVLGMTPAQRHAPTADNPEVFTVEMVDVSPTEFEYRPSEISVPRGAVVRFVQAGAMPHNVEFRDSPEGFDFGPQRVGPFLIQKGAVYEVMIDDRFLVGNYAFVCTPHEFMGMKGSLTVLPAGSDAAGGTSAEVHASAHIPSEK